MGVKSCPCTYFSPRCPTRETERTPWHSSSGLTWNFARFAATASAVVRSIEVGQKRCPCASFPLSECEKSTFLGFAALPLRPPCSGASKWAENDACALLFHGAYAQDTTNVAETDRAYAAEAYAARAYAAQAYTIPAISTLATTNPTTTTPVITAPATATQATSSAATITPVPTSLATTTSGTSA